MARRNHGCGGTARSAQWQRNLSVQARMLAPQSEFHSSTCGVQSGLVGHRRQARIPTPTMVDPAPANHALPEVSFIVYFTPYQPREISGWSSVSTPIRVAQLSRTR